MSENDPDPYLPPDQQSRSERAGVAEPDAGDPTLGGKRGQIGEAPSIASDEPDDGTRFPVGGGSGTEEGDAAAPATDPGRDA
jgi:hypothetical protein